MGSGRDALGANKVVRPRARLVEDAEMDDSRFWARRAMEQAAVVALVAAWLLVMISGAAGAAQEPRRRTPEETARYEAGLRAARKFQEGRDKAA